MTKSEIIEEIKSLIEKLDETMDDETDETDEIKIGDTYYYVSSGGEVIKRNWDMIYTDSLDNKNKEYYNMFRTDNGLYSYSLTLKDLNKLMQLKQKYCPDYFPDWDDSAEVKYYIAYDHFNNVWTYDETMTVYIPTVYFTEESASKAVKELNQESY